MKKLLDRFTTLINLPLTGRSRIMVALSALLLAPTFILPLWHLHLWSYQYPDGLDMYIYSYTIEGGRDDTDLQEVNILNHYIGMAEINEADFPELDWIPFALGIFIVLTLRAAVLGRVSKLIDVLVLMVYFGGFSLWSFFYKLYQFGHNLDPRAAVKIEPFTPPIFGLRDLAQFKVWSYPDWGTYLILAYVAVLAVALALTMVPRLNPALQAGTD